MASVVWYLVVTFAVLISSASQLLLKKSAGREHSSKLRTLLNWRVMSAYIIFFIALLLNITAMSYGVNLKDIPVIESLGFIFVPILSFLILKEKIDDRTLISILLILIGVTIFYL